MICMRHPRNRHFVMNECQNKWSDIPTYIHKWKWHLIDIVCFIQHTNRNITLCTSFQIKIAVKTPAAPLRSESGTSHEYLWDIIRVKVALRTSYVLPALARTAPLSAVHISEWANYICGSLSLSLACLAVHTGGERASEKLLFTVECNAPRKPRRQRPVKGRCCCSGSRSPTEPEHAQSKFRPRRGEKMQQRRNFCSHEDESCSLASSPMWTLECGIECCNKIVCPLVFARSLIWTALLSIEGCLGSGVGKTTWLLSTVALPTRHRVLRNCPTA